MQYTKYECSEVLLLSGNIIESLYDNFSYRLSELLEVRFDLNGHCVCVCALDRSVLVDR